MTKLKFRYGTMGSGKSLDLLRVAYNYEENDRKVMILTSAIDTRYGNNIIKSRTGLSKQAIGLHETDNIIDVMNSKILSDKISLLTNNPFPANKHNISNKSVDCILVDEVQFLTSTQIYQLAEIVDIYNIPVICYGLRTDFKMKPFEASVILMPIADEITEMITICSICGNKNASINAKFINGNIVKSGKQIDIGGNEKYKPLCRQCYSKYSHI